MAKAPSYSSMRQQKYTQKIRVLLQELPDFCRDFFRGLETNNRSALTRYEYALDLKLFFRYLCEELPRFSGKTVQSLTLEDIDSLQIRELEQFIDYVKFYVDNEGRYVENNEKAKARKIACLRTFYKFFFRREKLKNNPAALLEAPKLHDKAIIRLEANEVADLLDAAEDGSGLSDRQKKYHDATAVRDTAILTLFLGTGIRISELVGLNLDDLDFSCNGFRITRKGGNQVILYFSDEVADALKGYLALRQQITPREGHENALFLSMQRRRITDRAIQNLVKKYSSTAVPLKKISPHKLRSTYGTMLYQETGDIYVVADVLGHKDVNTTKRHYAAQTDVRRRQAARVVKLREE